jgi:Ca2+/Na+ antiporter
MKIPSNMKNFSPFELILMIIFIYYLILPVQFPKSINDFINTSIGIMIIFIICAALFLYCNPILGVLFIFVFYEFIYRSYKFVINKNIRHDKIDHVIDNTPSIVKQNYHNKNLKKVTPSEISYDKLYKPENVFQKDKITIEEESSLETELVNKMAPIGHSDPAMFIETSYKPTFQNIGNASQF